MELYTHSTVSFVLLFPVPLTAYRAALQLMVSAKCRIHTDESNKCQVRTAMGS